MQIEICKTTMKMTETPSWKQHFGAQFVHPSMPAGLELNSDAYYEWLVRTMTFTIYHRTEGNGPHQILFERINALIFCSVSLMSVSLCSGGHVQDGRGKRRPVGCRQPKLACPWCRPSPSG